jgi:hypothetical protein
MIKNCFINLFDKKYNNHYVYVHNLSHFDGVFLYKRLIENKDIKVEQTFKDDKFINIDVKFGPHFKYKIYLRDSMLMLPISLRNLCIAFNLLFGKD